MRDTRQFFFDGPYTRDELVDAMLRIAAGIRAGGLSLSMGKDEVTVFPCGELELEVAARTKKDKSRIDIAIAWRSAPDELPASPLCEDATDDEPTASAENPESDTAPVSPSCGARGDEDAGEETSRWVTRGRSSLKGQPRRPRRPSS
jgi:amphi-Trp domain-containing protein